MTPAVALCTDFGHRDHYVGVMRGVIATIAPRSPILDLCHEIAPQDLWAAAYMLDGAADYLPPGCVVVCVVDPGVGTMRRAIAASAGGRWWVGPDNGVFEAVWARHPPEAIVVLDEPRWWRHPVSATFHGRDIFAPCGAHLAAGVPIEALGTPLRPDELVTMGWSVQGALDAGAESVAARIIHVDHFGNLITDVSAASFLEGWARQASHVRVAGQRVAIGRTFGEVEDGALLVYAGSFGRLEIAVRGGDASRRLGVCRRDVVALTHAS